MNEELILELALPFCTINTLACIASVNSYWKNLVEQRHLCNLRKNAQLWRSISRELGICALCKMPNYVKFNQKYGMFYHDACVKPFLIPRFQLKFIYGMPLEWYKHMPSIIRTDVIHYRDPKPYTHHAIWYKPCDFIPYNWTAEYIIDSWIQKLNNKFG